MDIGRSTLRNKSFAESSKNVEKLRELERLLLAAHELLGQARDVERSFNYRVKLAEKMNVCVYSVASVLDEVELALRKWA